MTDSVGFRTVYGRHLVGELPNFVHRPYLVVTMADLWPRFESELAGDGLAGVHLVDTLDVDALERQLDAIPTAASVIGLGGGQAVDVAKFIAWQRRLPLFQVPTAMTVNAPFGHRAGLRRDGIVRYLGFAVPEAVYVDFDVVASAPPGLNRAGVGTSSATRRPTSTGGSPATWVARSLDGRTTKDLSPRRASASMRSWVPSTRSASRPTTGSGP